MSSYTNFSDSQVAALRSEIAQMLLQTELGDNTAALYTFSYAGRGNSTYSFGLEQFDVGHRQDARDFLSQIGFTSTEIAKLSQQGGLSAADWSSLNAKLSQHKAEVDQFSSKGLDDEIYRLDRLLSNLSQTNPNIANQIKGNTATLLAIADYDNQFRISGLTNRSPGPMLSWLQGQTVKLDGGSLTLGSTITTAAIYSFIRNTQYGVNPGNQKGVASRYARLQKVQLQLGVASPGTTGNSIDNSYSGYANIPELSVSYDDPITVNTARPGTVYAGDLFFTAGDAAGQVQPGLGYGDHIEVEQGMENDGSGLSPTPTQGPTQSTELKRKLVELTS